MKLTKENPITKDKLKTQIARAVLIAPDIDPKTGQEYTKEVVFTIRPGWSKVNKYETALPGGKITLSEGDFHGIIETDLQDDPNLVLTMEQMIQAGLNAAEREVLEEFGFVVTAGLLKFTDVSTNKAGWTTYSYVGELAEKPTLLVKPNSAGTRWISTKQLLEGQPRLLQGHLGITRRAIKSTQ